MPLLLNGVPAEKRSPVSDPINPDIIIEIMIPVRTSFKQVIDRVEVSYDEPVAGQPVPVLHLPAGANYVADPLAVSHWHDEDGYPVDTIENGKRYELNVKLFPNEGYEFSEDTVILINGVEDFSSVLNADLIHLNQDHSFLEQIHQVEVTYAAPEVGKAVPEFTVPADANYTVDAASSGWYNADTNEVATQIETGKDYKAHVRLLPKDGFEFSEEAKALVNGANSNDSYVSWSGVEITKRHSFKTQITAAQITYAAPEVGKAVPEFTVPADANYTLDAASSGWFDADTGVPATQIEQGKNYWMEVYLLAKEGFAFAEDVEMTVNGTVDGENDAGSYGDWAYYARDYRFKTQIDKIEVTYAAPEAGKDLPTVSVPADANYTLKTVEWVDEDTGDTVTKAEQGKAYAVQVDMEAKDGCELSDSVKVLVNGKTPDERFQISDTRIGIANRHSFKQVIDKVEVNFAAPEVGKPLPEFKLPEGANYVLMTGSKWTTDQWETATAIEASGAYWSDLYLEPKTGYEFGEDVVLLINGAAPQRDWTVEPLEINMGNRYTFRQQITEVALPAWPEVKVGDTLPTEVKLPEGVHYTASMNWEIVSASGGMARAGGSAMTAQSGVLYGAALQVVPLDGYEFSEDVVVTVGGKAISWLNANIDANDIRTGTYYDFDSGWTILDKIEITADGPAIGKVPGKVTAPTDAKYRLPDATWAVSDKADAGLMELDELEGAYAEGDYAYLVAGVQGGKKTVIGANVKIYVNGRELTEDEAMLMTESAVLLTVNFGKLEVPKPSAPATGDSFPMAALVVAALVSAAGIVVLSRKQKKA